MKMKDMNDLYKESLQDLYSAETQLLAALPQVMEAATSKELKATFKAHLAETKTQVTRLTHMLKDLGEEAGGHKCKAMEGLIKENDGLIKDVQEPLVLDAALIGGCQKIEHYEIAGYGTASTFAMMLGHEAHSGELQKTLDEEHAANAKLGELAVSLINEKALHAGEETAAKPAKESKR